MHQSHDWGEKDVHIFEENDCPSGCITFSDNSQGKIIGFGKINIPTEYSISKVLLVKSLDYNLLSVSQLCEKGYNCLFTNKGVSIFRRSDGSFIFKDVLRGKLYLVDFIPEEVESEKCLIEKTNMGWLWHHKLTHVGMRNIHKLQKEGLWSMPSWKIMLEHLIMPRTS
jgi:hypothetical protein